MTNRISFLSILFWVGCSFTGFSQTNEKVLVKHFKLLKGDWYGHLTYLDYSSNKPYTMPADVHIEKINKTNTFIFSNIYPDEPNANSVDTFVISQNGKMLNEESVKTNHIVDGGNREIVTEYLSVDGNENKPAIIRHTYTIGKNIFTINKEIQFVGEEKWFKRHEYSYKRSKGMQ